MAPGATPYAPSSVFKSHCLACSPCSRVGHAVENGNQITFLHEYECCFLRPLAKYQVFYMCGGFIGNGILSMLLPPVAIHTFDFSDCVGFTAVS